MEANLTTGDMLELTGMANSTFKEWCDKRIIKPALDARGTGNHRRFTFNQAVAVHYAKKWREVGAGIDLVGEIVEYLGGCDLEEELRNLRTHFVLIPGSMRLRPAMDGDESILNVLNSYSEVFEKARKLKASLAKAAKDGRRRGLATR